MAGIGRTHVTGYVINSTEDLDDSTLIHELTHVWQYEHTPAESTVVETYISYLRRKLDALGPPVITTRRGVGYGLT